MKSRYRPTKDEKIIFEIERDTSFKIIRRGGK